MAQSEYDIVIVGAGVVGASSALALNNIGYKCLLLDGASPVAEKQFPENTRVAALGQQSQTLLSSLGVWQSLSQQFINPYTAMQVWDESSLGELNFNSSDYGYSELGFICDQFALQDALQQACQRRLTVRFGETFKSVNNSQMGVEVMLDDGELISAKLLIAADGVNSPIRSYLDIPVQQKSYQQTAIVSRVACGKSHHNTAWQRFLTSGPLAFLPLANGDCSIVWSVIDDLADELLLLDQVSFEKRIQAAIQNELGDLKLQDKRYRFSLNSVRAEQYLSNRVLLIGDAAHGIHPLAGQGANLGLADVATLASVLKDKPRIDQSQRFLRQYERERKVDNYATDGLMSAINHLFLNQNKSITSLRGIGMKGLDQQAFLKRMLIDAAARD